MLDQAYQYSISMKLTNNNIIVTVSKIQSNSIHDDYVNNFLHALYRVFSQKNGFSQLTMNMLNLL